MNSTPRFAALAGLLVLLVQAAPVAGQNLGGIQPGRPEGVEEIDRAEGDDAQRLAADGKLQQMVAAYREAPALIDRIELRQFYGQSPVPPASIDVRIGAGTDAQISGGGTSISCVDGKVYLTDEKYPDKYVVVDMKENLIETCIREFNTLPNMSFYLSARYGRAATEILRSLAFGMPGALRVSNFRTIVDVEGRELDQVTLLSPDGVVALNMDPRTHLLTTASCEYTPPGAPVPNFYIRREFTFHPQILAELPEPLAFDPDGRRAVSTPQALAGMAEDTTVEVLKIAAGTVVEDFEAITLEGARVRLADERERGVVVLVFWGQWNVESLAGMERVVALADAAKESGEFVVWPVNTRERGLDRAERWERAFGWWDEQRIRYDSVFDHDDAIAAAWGIEALPLTVVIRRDGTVQAIIPNLSTEWTGQVEQAIEAARSGG